jgi:SNF2 family DNA or RNA helicase
MSMAERDKVKKLFYEEGSPRVMTISKVAQTGLNLSRANHLIMSVSPPLSSSAISGLPQLQIKDVQWAAQDQKQIEGRLKRPPQKKKIHTFNLIAQGTTDEMMARVAGRKAVLLGEFLQGMLA